MSWRGETFQMGNCQSFIQLRSGLYQDPSSDPWSLMRFIDSIKNYIQKNHSMVSNPYIWCLYIRVKCQSKWIILCLCCSNVWIYQTLLPQAGCDTRLFFKWSWFEFSFPSPKSVAVPRLEPNLPNNLLILRWKNRWSLAIPKDISMKWNANTLTSKIWTQVTEFIS